MLIGGALLSTGQVANACDSSVTDDIDINGTGFGSNTSLAACQTQAVNACRADVAAQLAPESTACRDLCREAGCSTFGISYVGGTDCHVTLSGGGDPYFCIAAGVYQWKCNCF